MKRDQVFWALLALPMVSILGCSTPSSGPTVANPSSTSVQQREKTPLEIWQFAGRGGNWLFIPRQRVIDDAPYGYPAEVRMPEFKFSTNRIRVVVGGEVEDPGEINVRNGTTVLEAIARVGGFTTWAAAKRIYLTRAGKGHRLRLMGRDGGAPTYRQVWYVDTSTGPDAIETSTKPWEISDIILEDGDRVYVPRVVF